MSIPQIFAIRHFGPQCCSVSITVSQKAAPKMMYEVCEDKIRSRRFGNPSRSSYRSILLLE
ncbi:hypothetical protein DL98DRAFT_522799 [Cadophora sp. DSE1049]|nr:hypothetical protein DL98DRAFT_522799 [Cadophora sp. DSE1049]